MPNRSKPPNWLGTTDHARLSLRVERYQFATAGSRYDLNWLTMHGQVEDGDRRWKFLDPCMLTWELEALIAWLRAIPSPPFPSISFLEPLLEFRFDGAILDRVVVVLRAEAVPRSIDEFDERWEKGVTLELEANMNAVNRFADALQRDLDTYPVRGQRS